MPKNTHGGAREGAGRKPIHTKIKALGDVTTKTVAEAERDYVDGRSRAVLMELLSDGEIHPFEAIFEGFRFFHGQAVAAKRLAEAVYDTDPEKQGLHDQLMKKAGENHKLAAGLAEKVLPYAFPKLASIDHTGQPPPKASNGPTYNVFLQGAIDRLAAQSGAGRDILEHVIGGTGAPDLRLEVLGPAGTIRSDVEPQTS